MDTGRINRLKFVMPASFAMPVVAANRQTDILKTPLKIKFIDMNPSIRAKKSPMLMMAFCEIVYTNITEMFEWFNIYRFYAIPFQIILPLLLWILAEIKAKKAARGELPAI
jgi:hypothetical protein